MNTSSGVNILNDTWVFDRYNNKGDQEWPQRIQIVLLDICHPYKECEVIGPINRPIRSFIIDYVLCGGGTLGRNSSKPRMTRSHNKNEVSLNLREEKKTH